jgi:hypothetical protein
MFFQSLTNYKFTQVPCYRNVREGLTSIDNQIYSTYSYRFQRTLPVDELTSGSSFYNVRIFLVSL